MLVLTRKKEEKLQIGQEITITVLRIKGNSVQLGIEAPRNVRVMRQELLAQAPRTNDDCDLAEMDMEGADEVDAPKQPAKRALPRTQSGSSLHAMVAQVFKPVQHDRLMSV
jgi:carbon storage regulator CsrA